MIRNKLTLIVLFCAALGILAAPAQAATELEKAARSGKPGKVRELVEGGAPITDAVMLLAAEKLGRKSGKLEVLEYLLAEGGNPDAEMNGFTPLISAAMGGSLDGVRALLDAGADPGKPGKFIKDAITPLGGALFSRKPEIAKMLAAAGADVNAPAFGKMSAMDMAASMGMTDLAAVLAEAGADVNKTGPLGASAMHAAAREGNIDALQSMMRSGGDPNGRDKSGKTPLHYALAGGHADAAKLLLDAGADVNATDDNGVTPLMDAAASRSGAAVRMALDAGADPDARDNNGKHAAEKGRGVDEAVEPIVEASPEIRENREAPEIGEGGEVPAGGYATPCGESGGDNLPASANVCGVSGTHRMVFSLIREDGAKAGKVVPPLCEPFDFKPGSEYQIFVIESSYDWEWECRYELKTTTGDTKILSYKKKTNETFSQKTIEVTVTPPDEKPDDEEKGGDLQVFLAVDPDDGKFSFDESGEGILEIRVRAEVSGDIDPDTIEWSMDTIGNAKMTVEPERGAHVTIRFEGLPDRNSQFGDKTITARAGGKSASLTLEVYFDPRAKNHPRAGKGGRFGGAPNWFHYWEQTSAGGSFQPHYAPRRRSCGGGAIIGQYVYADDKIYLTDGVIDGVCVERSDGRQAKRFDCYAETLRHENVHDVEFRAWYAPLPGGPQECIGAYGKNDNTTLLANIAKLTIDPDRDLVPTYVEFALMSTRGCNPLDGASCSGRPAHLNVGDVEMNAYTIGWAAWPPCSAPAEDWSRDGQQWTGECD